MGPRQGERTLDTINMTSAQTVFTLWVFAINSTQMGNAQVHIGKVLLAIPNDTETVIVSTKPFRLNRSFNAFNGLLAPVGPRSLIGFLEKREIKAAIEASRAFGNAKVFGDWKYEGCTVFSFSDAVNPRDLEIITESWAPVKWLDRIIYHVSERREDRNLSTSLRHLPALISDYRLCPAELS